MDVEVADPLLDSQYEWDFCPTPRQVLRVCLNLKTLIDKVIPIVFNESDVVEQNSAILNKKVISLVYEAAGGKGDGKIGTTSYRYRACLVFCLLKVCDWYWQQAESELSDNELFSLRAVAAQTIAAIVIENEKDDKYLFLGMLCHRYSVNLKGVNSEAFNALEMAVDMHSTIVISSSGFQRCIKWLWRGWIVQSSKNPHAYVLYKGVASSSIRTHFDPDRIKTPLYQNIIEIIFSFIYLILFTIVLNGHQETTASLAFTEMVFFFMTAGSIYDEAVKFYHVGANYFGFWNAFNDVMYAIIVASISFRVLSINSHGDTKEYYDEIAFRVLSCVSPLMWTRLLLYLDAEKFVGAMLVVVKTMMKESLLFFVLLFVVIIGFVQGFLGLDASDGKNEATKKILISLVKAIIGGSSFGDFAKLVPPYASILYYIYSFLLSVILMNILIALYSTAYAAIVANATSEYLALVAQKTLRYIRAPDLDLYVPPFNLIELALFPLSFLTSKRVFKKINYTVMVIIYSPFLIYITMDELHNARRIHYNRFKGLPDDANEFDTEWDLTDGFETDANDQWDGIQEQNIAIASELGEQRRAELEDPEFSIDIEKFKKSIDEVVQPVTDAHLAGMKWEIYGLYTKLDKLTILLEATVEENNHLKAQIQLKT